MPQKSGRNGSGAAGSLWQQLRCLALLAGVSIAMPGMTAQLQPDSCTGFETAASMYGGGDALGYIIVGLLAFLLGVCMTILCFRLRQMERDEKDEGQHGAD